MRHWFRRRRPSVGEFAKEIEAHLACEIDDQVDRGVPREEARFAALRAFGRPARAIEQYYESQPWYPLDTLRLDFRDAMRSLYRARGISVLVIASIGLGVGATTAVFTLAKAAVLAPLGLPHPDRLGVVVGQTSSGPTRGFRYEDARLLQSAAAGAATAGMYLTWGWPVAADGREDTLGVLLATPEFIKTTGVAPAVGRWPTAAEHASARPVAVLAHWWWRDAFDGAADVLSRSVSVDGTAVRVIGVAPAGLKLEAGTDGPAVICPASLLRVLGRNVPFGFFERGGRRPSLPVWQLLLRRHPDVSFDQLEARLRHARHMSSDLAAGKEAGSIAVLPAAVAAIPLESRRRVLLFLTVLGGVAAMVLAIGCTNIATASLARLQARQREMAMRAALGASRRRLLRPVIIETVVLATAGGLGGLLLALMLLHVLAPYSLGPVEIRALSLAPDSRVLGFTAATAAVVAIIMGLMPAWRLSRLDALSIIRNADGRRAVGGLNGRAWLLTAQVGLSTTLLIGAGLFGRSLQQGLYADLPYDPNRILTVSFSTDPKHYDPVRARAARQRVLAALRQIPGVERAGLGPPPLSRLNWLPDVSVDGQTLSAASGPIHLAYVDAQYRAALGLQLVAGRDFTERDEPTVRTLASPGTPAHGGRPVRRVALVNEAFVTTVLGRRDPFRVRMDAPGSAPGTEPSAMEIVGVVADTRFDDLRQSAVPALYVLGQGFDPAFYPAASAVVRTSIPATAVRPAVERSVRSLLPESLPPQVATADETLRALLKPQRMGALFLGWFSCLALVLAAIGAWGLAASAASSRRTEMAVRMVLGATPGRIVRAVLSAGFRPIALGILCGLGAAAWLTERAAPFLIDVGPRDLPTFAAAAVLLVLVGGLATWLPLRRATTCSPATILKEL